VKERELEILGYQNQPLENILKFSSDDKKHVVMLLPGMGYTFSHPALHFARRIARQLGADELLIDPTYRTKSFANLPESQKQTSALADADAIAKTIVGLGYARVSVVGKSFATLLMAHMLPQFPNWHWAWFTPLLNTPEVANALQNVPHKGFVAIGSSDHHFNAAVMENLHQKLETVMFAGADHSFELENDVLGSVQIQLELTKQMLAFLE
jgi:hypothetical protein